MNCLGHHDIFWGTRKNAHNLYTCDFIYYLEQHHPGKKYLPIIRVLGGARQDSSFEGSLPIYDGRADMLDFTNEFLLSILNLLQQSLFIVLGSMEVIAQLRVASILH